MTRTAAATRPDTTKDSSMNRRLSPVLRLRWQLSLALAIAGLEPASADPPGTPGTPPAGKTANQIYARCRCRRVRGADQQRRQ